MRRSLIDATSAAGYGEEVEHVGDRRAVEVAVGLDATVDDDRVVDGRRELVAATHARVRDRVARRAGDLRCAAHRVRVLDVGAVRPGVRGDDRRVGEQRAHVRGGDGLPGVRTQRLQVGGEHTRGAEHGLDAHRRGDVGCAQQQVEVVAGEQQLAEHAVGAVDEGQTLLLGEGRPARARAARKTSAAAPSAPSAVATVPSPIRASATWASGARSPEQPSEPYSCTTGVMPLIEQRRPGAAAVSGRTPVWPVASVDSRSSIIARTTSRSTSGPRPAACERISDCCSSARCSTGMCLVASAPKPVEMP